MAETSQAVDLRNTNDGRRFSKILWLIAALALLFCVLGIVIDWFTASASYFGGRRRLDLRQRYLWISGDFLRQRSLLERTAAIALCACSCDRRMSWVLRRFQRNRAKRNGCSAHLANLCIGLCSRHNSGGCPPL